MESSPSPFASRLGLPEYTLAVGAGPEDRRKHPCRPGSRRGSSSGTIRALDETTRGQLHRRTEEVATRIAESAGAKAEVEIELGYPVTASDTALVDRIALTVERLFASEDIQRDGKPSTGSEDFSYFSQEVPGVYFGLGVRDPAVPMEQAARNHSPGFSVDESSLRHGVRLLGHVTLDVLHGAAGK